MGALRFIQDNAKFLLAGILLTLNSSFGQTFFISIFAAEIMATFQLSNGAWGLVYTIGTAASAVVMFWVGALTDRFRARRIAWFVMPALALTCVAMSVNVWVPGLVLVIFFLRFLGQGMAFLLATVSMARWFSARRGLALSVSASGIWIGQAFLPVTFAALLVWMDWRALWLVAAGFVLLSVPVVLWLLALERTPQSLAKEAQVAGMLGRHWTRSDVLQSRFFWMLVPLLLGPPAWGTALFFQQVHIAAVKGWPLVEYLALIPVMTLVSAAATLVTGQLVDRLGSGRLLQAFPLSYLIGFLVLSQVSTLAGAAFAFVVFGAAIGMQTTLITAFWAEYFGTRHIGAIKATSTSIMVFGSAIGPGISGALIDFGYDFPSQMLAIAGYFAFVFVMTWLAVARATQDLAPPIEIDVERA